MHWIFSILIIVIIIYGFSHLSGSDVGTSDWSSSGIESTKNGINYSEDRSSGSSYQGRKANIPYPNKQRFKH